MAEEFLAELEACALPPQPKKLFDDDVENDRGRGGGGEAASATPAAPAFAANIELGRRINNINLNKQKNMNKSDVIVPSSAGMVSLGRRPPHEQRGELISRDEVQNWKAQVLSSNRPRNQWGGLSNSEAALAESRQYARSLAALNAPPEPIEIRTEGVDSVRSFSGSDEDVFPSPPQEHEHQRHRQGSRLAPFSGSSLKPASSTSAAVTPPESDKYSDYSSASSNKSSASPPQTSPNPLDYSLSASAYHRPSDLYRTAPAEVFRTTAGAKPAPPPVAKKTVSLLAAASAKQSQQRPLPYHTSLRSQTRTSNSDNFNPLKVPVDPFGYVWQPSTSKTEEVAVDPNDPAARGVFRVVEHPPLDSSKKTAAENRKSTGPDATKEAYGSSLSTYSKLVSPEAFRGVSSTTPPLMTSSPKNAPRNAAFSPTFSNSSRQPSEASSVPSSVDEARRRQRWRELADAADDADRAFAERRALLQASAGVRGSASLPGAPPPAMRSVVPIAIGDCALCHRPLTDSDDTVTTENDGRSFHDACFACSVCRRQLRDRHYHSAKGRLYCDEDFEYTGRQETTEKCAKCGHPIVDMVLQALGRYFHPACFRCTKCRVCLDGIPFALDSKGEVYCMADYHALYAPRCAACTEAILPDAKTGETVRVVAINNDYHVECYVCEGCKVRLTDESTSRCFPLGRHLLCYDCHVVWRRTGGDSQKITDL